MKSLFTTTILLISFFTYSQIGLSRKNIEDKLIKDGYEIIDSKPNYTTIKIKGKVKIIYAYGLDQRCYSTYVFKTGAKIGFFSEFMKKNNFQKKSNLTIYKKENEIAIIKEDLTGEYYVEIQKDLKPLNNIK